MNALKKILSATIPASLFSNLLASYHFLFAWGAAFFYGFPSRKLFVIGITGTKGKSSVSEMVNAILEEAGDKTVLGNTIRFKIGSESRPNLFKMTMPGRGYIQSVLAEARKKDCTHAVIEITSEAARQFRHHGIDLNALIFTNIAPEHIESHGSYDAYKKAKLGIGMSLVHSPKRPRIVVANADDELGKKFLELPVERCVPFHLTEAKPYELGDEKVSVTFSGVTFDAPFPGEFTILNVLAAATLAKEIGIAPEIIARAFQNMRPIPGRAEKIECGQDFLAVVDYAHTADSLRALYEAYPKFRKICVLGATGGGRDHWKRPAMGSVADEYCAEIILTNDDPYEEDPNKIVEAIASGIARKKPRMSIDRREAIRVALSLARAGDAVLITGKGTDPFLMEAGGTKTPWSDARVVKEELAKLLKKPAGNL